jgi:hypothetical protein
MRLAADGAVSDQLFFRDYGSGSGFQQRLDVPGQKDLEFSEHGRLRQLLVQVGE